MLILLISACERDSTEVEGYYEITQVMPLDGERRGVYVNEAVDWDLVVEKTATTPGADGVEIVTMTWSRDDTGELLGSVLWSSVYHAGVYIHGYAVGADAPTLFDTPVAFSDDDGLMQCGDVVQTITNGYTFTSTFIDHADCPVAWGEDWWGCYHFGLDDGDDDDLAGPLFAGEYWLVTKYGPAWMGTTGYSEVWDLADYVWSGDG